jgi:hypothetical protein
MMAAMSMPYPDRRRRPFTLIALASLMLLKAALLLGVAAGVTMDGTGEIVRLLRLEGFAEVIRTEPAAVGLTLVVAGLLTLAALGVLALRRTGWLLAMVLTGVFVGIDIFGFLGGGANHLWMALNIITVFYLNQRDVRGVVGATGALGDPVEGHA